MSIREQIRPFVYVAPPPAIDWLAVIDAVYKRAVTRYVARSVVSQRQTTQPLTLVQLELPLKEAS